MWSRHEDIQTGKVRGALSWTGRRYRAGTMRAGWAHCHNSAFIKKNSEADQLEEQLK
ncbi:hypothetical protein F511_13172 [Dorcoceras hygrometricum]|uniref:Uncharacterized protein n=1 Tax=Dorcoceras hygrometricum TaxID=472368 RepID=A0A2Z7BH56_9LAMI|nr:hypothetical protein F511_13172 [Dorcoceras hygrometricum]